MTQEEFIKKLDKKGYSYEIEGDKIIVTHGGDIMLNSMRYITHGVVFNNGGFVNLANLKTLPPDVEFNNSGFVSLHELKKIPPGMVFNNKGEVYLSSLITLPTGVVFNNEGGIDLTYLIRSTRSWDGYIRWNGNIKGIDTKKIIKLMIKRGMFI